MLARWVTPRKEATTWKSVFKNSDFGPAFIYNKFHFYNKQNNYGIGILNWQHVGGKTCNNSCTDICNLLQPALVLIFAINCNQFLYWYLQWPMYWYWWRVLKCVGLIHRRESCKSVIHSGTWSRNTFSVLWLTSAVPLFSWCMLLPKMFYVPFPCPNRKYQAGRSTLQFSASLIWSNDVCVWTQHPDYFSIGSIKPIGQFYNSPLFLSGPHKISL